MTHPSDTCGVGLAAEGSCRGVLPGLSRYLVKEWQRTLNWMVLVALLLVINVCHTVFELLGILHKMTENPDDEFMAALAGIAAVNGIIMVSLWWAAARMVRYLAAIFRLREDSSLEEAEEVLMRQRRLWKALAFAAAGYLLSTVITAPVSTSEAKQSVADKQAWDEELRKIREE